MKGEILFEKMTGISEEYITEAALVPALGASPAERPESRFAALSRVLNSGWGVACICFIVAIAAVVGMVAWGRMGEMIDPGSDPAVRFAFSYEMTDNDGSAWSGTAMPGDVVNVSTTVVNHGKTFVTDDFFAWAKFVLQEDESVVIEGDYPLVESIKHPVKNGDQGTISFHFHIPENATPGVYDLVLSYGEEQQVYTSVLTVEEETDKPFPELTDGHPFSFGYELFLSSTIPTGTELILEAWVVNDGEGFKVNGEFRPQATLCYADESVPYTIQGELIKEGVSSTITYVESGATGRGAYIFDIPEDAPTGSYRLVLSFGGASQSFEKVLTVVELTEPDLDYPTLQYGHPFSFGYEPFGGFAIPGDEITVNAWVVNEGEPFSFVGDPNDFKPWSATLYHMETSYIIEGELAPSGRPPRPCNVKTGQKGTGTFTFSIPADAPTGEYELRLSYHEQEQSFEGVLTVAVPTVEDNTHIDPDELWEVAEQYISQVVENTDPAHYTRGSITTTTFPSGEYSICFGFHVNLLDMTTEETLYITLNGQGQYLSHEQDPQTYSLFIPYITTEMVEAAKPPLYEHPDAPLKLKHQYGYAIQDGDLYLTYTCYAEPGGNFETAWECLYSTQVFLYPNPQTE